MVVSMGAGVNLAWDVSWQSLVKTAPVTVSVQEMVYSLILGGGGWRIRRLYAKQARVNDPARSISAALTMSHPFDNSSIGQFTRAL